MIAGALRFEQGSRTDVGCVRTVNEDACLARADAGLWAVADGMGGHARGRWAATRIAASLDAALLPDPLDPAVAAVHAALDRANAQIVRAGVAERRVIGSTVAALVVRARRCVVLWAGDSRVYRLRDGALAPLTTDHSPVAQMVAAGLLSRAEAADHPMGHMLARAVGVQPALALERRDADVLPGDTFLLCSDGLTRMLDETAIAALLQRERPHRCADALVDLAVARGAADNVTAVVVGCDETTQVLAR